MAMDSRLIGAWRAQEIGGRPLGEDVASTIAFGDDGRVAGTAGRVAGTAGVNRFGGPYRFDGHEIELGPLVSTRMAGPAPAMQQEQDFLAAVSGRRPFAMDGEALVIGQGPEQVRLLRVDEAPRTTAT
jgi:heat shock protein HslJ